MVEVSFFEVSVNFRGVRGQNRKIWIHTYVRIFDTIRLRPKKAKKNWELRPLRFFKKKFFRKKNFRGFGNSPKMEKERKFWILEINRKHSYGHFKPSLGCFGWKMKVQRNVKVKKRENLNRLEPPLSAAFSRETGENF